MRKEVFKNVFVGDAFEFEKYIKLLNNWGVIHACKDPYHRQLLGYKTHAAPKTHSEYLMALRGDALFLNLVDSEDKKFIPEKIFQVSFLFIDRVLEQDKKVFIHCNKGESRAPAIAFLWMFFNKHLPQNYLDAFLAFEKVYPKFKPSTGVKDFCRDIIETAIKDI